MRVCRSRTRVEDIHVSVTLATIPSGVPQISCTVKQAELVSAVVVTPETVELTAGALASLLHGVNNRDIATGYGEHSWITGVGVTTALCRQFSATLPLVAVEDARCRLAWRDLPAPSLHRIVRDVDAPAKQGYITNFNDQPRCNDW